MKLYVPKKVQLTYAIDLVCYACICYVLYSLKHYPLIGIVGTLYIIKAACVTHQAMKVTKE